MNNRVKYITNMLHICNIFIQYGQNPHPLPATALIPQ